MYGKGISKEGNILDAGVDADIIDKAGSWYSYGDNRLGQGRENSKDFLIENPDIALEIENKIRIKYNLIDENDVSKELTNEAKDDTKDTKNKDK